VVLLEAQDLWAGYGEAVVLRGLSLRVPEGAIVALVGANGAGKTTLLCTLSGLVRPTRGRIVYDGRDITDLPPDRIVEAGLLQVPEGRKLFPALTVYENLAVGATAARARRQRQENLEFVYSLFPLLRERRDQLAGTLSGGEQQMLALGRALMADPRLLMLDETSLGLAPLVVDEIFEAITALNRRGLTVLLVEQNTALALEVAGYAYVLEHGQVVLEGRAADLAADDRVRKAYLGI
jgi:branched-chain amino acid transport system ATP-binding protein